MKSKIMIILLIGVPVWTMMIMGGMDKGETMGSAKVERIVSCSKGNCVAVVSLNDKQYHVSIYQNDVNMNTCILSKHQGLGKLTHSEYSCREN